MADPDPMTPLDDDLLDRMVDGAITPGELRTALDRLDHEPDGWKRCALAFLEAQCWGEAFRALDDPAGARLECAARLLPSTAGRTGRAGGRWRRGVMAAGVAAASFVMGWLGHSAALPPSPRVGAGRGGGELASGAPPLRLPPQGWERKSVPPPHPSPTRGEGENAPPNPSAGIVAVARLRIGSEDDSAEVPILAGPGIDEEWLNGQPPPVSEHGQAYWQRRGYQVDQRRRIITATLADGRRVTVPIDQVQIRYTGNDPL